MTTDTIMSISLPEDMRRWLDDQVKADGFANAGDLVLALIREKQRRAAREQLDRRLVEALDSGEMVEMTSADWAEIRNTARERLAAKAAGK